MKKQMKDLLIGVWVVVLWSVGAGAQTPAETVQKLIQEARSLNEQRAFPQAIEKLGQARKMAEQIDDPTLLGESFYYLGVSHLSLELHGIAFEKFQQALRMYERAKALAGMARTWNAIGEIYTYVGQYKESAEAFIQSMKLYQDIESQLPAGSPRASTAMAMVGQRQTNIGLVYFHWGRFNDAKKYFDDGMKTCERLAEQKLNPQQESGNLMLRFVLYGNLGAVEREFNNDELALEYLRSGLDLAEKTKFDHAGMERQRNEAIIVNLFNIGSIYAKRRQEEAMGYAERALDMARKFNREDIAWQALALKGKIHLDHGRFIEAREAITQAIEIIERSRRLQAGALLDLIRFLDDKLSPYALMVDLLHKQNEPAEAFAFAERAKAAVLLEILRNKPRDLSGVMTREETAQQRKLNQEIAALNNRLIRLQSARQPDRVEIDKCKKELERAQSGYDLFLTTVANNHPESRVKPGPIQPLTPEQAVALLPDANTAVLEFVVAEDQAFLFVLNGRRANHSAPIKPEMYPIAIEQKVLRERVERFRAELAAGKLSDSLSRELYNLLLGQARTLPKGGNLIIVPDGPLWNLPFGALRSPEKRYLLEDHALSLVPSLGVLRELIQWRKENRNTSQAHTLLAFGNPMLSSGSAGRPSSVLRDTNLGPLPSAETEALSLAQLYGPARSRVYTGEEAREDRFKAEAAQFSILHLAVHGIFNNAKPIYSQLVLAQTAAEAQEDGVLEAREILNLKLKADLAVLSACETARGGVGGGEGMIGLTWAMFVAGVPTTVVSHWNVQDNSTRDLMVEFHRQLQSPPLQAGRTGNGACKTKAEALRQAALKLIAGRLYSEPFRWAAFVAVGDGYSCLPPTVLRGATQAPQKVSRKR